MQVYDGFDAVGCEVSEKLDGVNATWNGRDLISRDGNRFDAPEWFTAALPDKPVEGELWICRGGFEQTLSVVSSRDAGDRWQQVRYMIFAGPRCPVGDFAGFVQQHTFGTTAAVDAFYSDILANGGEGIVIRDRTGVCHKRKPITDDDAIVVAYLAGNGRNAHRLGAIRVRDRVGREFKIGVGFSDADRNAPPKIGAVVRFSLQGRTARGVPRFASYLGCRAESTFVGVGAA